MFRLAVVTWLVTLATTALGYRYITGALACLALALFVRHLRDIVVASGHRFVALGPDGWPVERFYGRPVTNAIRLVLWTRRIVIRPLPPGPFEPRVFVAAADGHVAEQARPKGFTTGPY